MPLICGRFFLTTELDCTFRFTESAYAASTCELRSQGQLGRILSHRIDRQGASHAHAFHQPACHNAQGVPKKKRAITGPLFLSPTSQRPKGVVIPSEAEESLFGFAFTP
jgi:hypothetical protein